MTRRASKAARRARFTLGTGIAAGIAATTWTGEAWAGALACLTTWTLIGLVYALLHRTPRRAPTEHQASIENRPTALYHRVGWTTPVIYVGIVGLTNERDADDRDDEHARRQPWWHHEGRDTITIAIYPTRTQALAAEAYDIHLLNPPRNRTHKRHSLAACPTIRATRQVAA